MWKLDLEFSFWYLVENKYSKTTLSIDFESHLSNNGALSPGIVLISLIKTKKKTKLN